MSSDAIAMLMGLLLGWAGAILMGLMAVATAYTILSMGRPQPQKPYHYQPPTALQAYTAYPPEVSACFVPIGVINQMDYDPPRKVDAASVYIPSDEELEQGIDYPPVGAARHELWPQRFTDFGITGDAEPDKFE